MLELWLYGEALRIEDAWRTHLPRKRARALRRKELQRRAALQRHDSKNKVRHDLLRTPTLKISADLLSISLRSLVSTTQTANTTPAELSTQFCPPLVMYVPTSAALCDYLQHVARQSAGYVYISINVVVIIFNRDLTVESIHILSCRLLYCRNSSHPHRLVLLEYSSKKGYCVCALFTGYEDKSSVRLPGGQLYYTDFFSLNQLPSVMPKGAMTQRAPPTMLPRVTGIKFLKKN